MTSSRLLGPLIDAIESARRQMLAQRRDLSDNETRTRTALINPILHALDWNVSDSSSVRTEHNLPSGRVDYALGWSFDRVFAVIEAKKLGEGLKPYRGQLVRYAYESSPSYAVLTNGDDWELYAVETSEREFHLRLVETCTLSSENDPLQSARKLLALWQANVESGRPVEADGSAEPSTSSNGSTKTGGGTPPADEGWVSLSEFSPPARTRAPFSIRFPGNRARELSKWSEMVVEMTNWLFDSGHLNAQDAPIVYSKSGHIHSQPVNREGKDMDSPHQIRNQNLFVETAGTGKVVVQRSTNILNLLKIDPAAVHVRPRISAS